MKGIYIVIIVIIILVLLIILIYTAKNIYLSNSLSQDLRNYKFRNYKFSIYDNNDPSTKFYLYTTDSNINKKIVDDNYIFKKFKIYDIDVIDSDNLNNFIKIFGIYEFEFDWGKDIEGQINSKYNSSLEKPIDYPFIIDIENRKENRKIVSIPVLMKFNDNNIELYNDYNNTRIILYYKPKRILSETKLMNN